MSESRVRVVTAEECHEGITGATAELIRLGTTPEEVEQRGSVCHHEADAYDELRKWQYLLNGGVSRQDGEQT